MSEQTTLKIEGMSCQMCVKHVTKALVDLEGVSQVAVSLEQAQAVIHYDPDKANLPAFRAAVADAGYEVIT